MLKKLRSRFILITMSLISVILIIILIGVCFFMAQSEEYQSLMQMEEISKSEGIIRHPIPPMFIAKDTKPPKHPPFPLISNFSSNSFAVKLNADGTVIEITPQFESEIQTEQIPDFIAQVETQNQPEGIIKVNNIQVRFLKTDKPYGSIIVFLDRTTELATLNRLLLICTLIGFISLIILFIITVRLSKWAISPIETAWEKQKQFVADASHELKTPLTVITTNIDVVLSNSLDYVENQSKWLHYIKSEVNRMTKLVNDLLYLAKLDDDTRKLIKSNFNMSEVYMNTCLPFESIVFESHKFLNLDIASDLMYYGDESRLKQVMVILIDNAIKNTPEGGLITLALKSTHNKIILSITNTGPGIPNEYHDKIFERFYRVDSSRARQTGGYGLGLSIAKSIVTQHQGTIHVSSSVEGPTTFTVILPLKILY